jgi:hypothetical protein
MKSGRGARTAVPTVADLVTELQAVPPRLIACVLDDQGFPHAIVRIRYRMDLDMVAIESGSPICTEDHKPRHWPPN